MKRLVRTILRKFGFEVRRLSGNNPSPHDFVTAHRIDLILDVGANVGQFARSILDRGYQGEIISFEPVRAVFAQTARAAASHPRWKVENFALGDAEGTADIHIARNTVFSSLLDFTPLATAFDANAAQDRSETIAVKRLDDLGLDLKGRRVLLKIDTQGFERQVLEGGARLLGDVEGILLELPIEHLYQGVWSFSEAVAFLNERGFVLAQVHTVNTLRDDPSAAIEFDCLFRRRVLA